MGIENLVSPMVETSRNLLFVAINIKGGRESVNQLSKLRVYNQVDTVILWHTGDVVDEVKVTTVKLLTRGDEPRYTGVANWTPVFILNHLVKRFFVTDTHGV